MKSLGARNRVFKFLHAADIHLDSPLRGLVRYDGAPLDLFRTAPRQALANLVDLAIREVAAFVVIAGDLYDGQWRDFNTGIFFAAQMGRLRQHGIRVVVLHGNHDAESQITKSLSLPDNVFVFGNRGAETIDFDDLGVALHGHSYRQRETKDDLVPGYPDPQSGRLNIGVLHTAVDGHPDHAPYAPCALDELKAKGYAYWALGHVHQAKVLSQAPFVVFPGNIQGRNMRETGAKGAMLVTVAESEIVDVEPVHVDVVRWAQVSVDIGGAHKVDSILGRVHDALEQAIRDQAGGRVMAARIALTGRTPAYGQILHDEAHFKAEVRSIAAGFGSDTAWIEKVQIRAEPEIDDADAGDRDDAIGVLQRMLQEAPDDAALADELRSDFAAILAKLPAEIRNDDEPGLISALKNDRIDQLVREMGPGLMARLLSEAL